MVAIGADVTLGTCPIVAERMEDGEIGIGALVQPML